MSQFTIYYDKEENRLFMQKDNDISIPGPAEELNNQLTEFYNNSKQINQSSQSLIEINTLSFFEKFKFQRGPKGEKGEPGIMGPQGPKGDDTSSAILLERIEQMEKKINELSEIIKTTKQLEIQTQKKKHTIGFKVDQKQLTNEIKLTIKKNINDVYNIYDTFYIGTNKIIKNIDNLKIEKFVNKNDVNDIQYFPSTFINNFDNGINIKLHNKPLNTIKISNISPSIIKPEAVTYNINKIIKKNVSLYLFFEIHTTQTISHPFLFPYYDAKYNSTCPNNTCLTAVKRVKLSDDIDNIEIPLYCENSELTNVVLHVRIGLTRKNEEELESTDINKNKVYGYIPMSEFDVSFNLVVN